MCVGRKRCLHSYFYRFPGAQRNVSEELGGCGRSKIDEGFVDIGSQPIAVEVLENFVEAIFASPLERVADEGGCPTEEDAADALASIDHFPRLCVRFVKLVVDLTPAFYLDISRLAIVVKIYANVLMGLLKASHGNAVPHLESEIYGRPNR